MTTGSERAADFSGPLAAGRARATATAAGARPEGLLGLPQLRPARLASARAAARLSHGRWVSGPHTAAKLLEEVDPHQLGLVAVARAHLAYAPRLKSTLSTQARALQNPEEAAPALRRQLQTRGAGQRQLVHPSTLRAYSSSRLGEPGLLGLPGGLNRSPCAPTTSSLRHLSIFAGDRTRKCCVVAK